MFILAEATFWDWLKETPIPLLFGVILTPAGLVLILTGFGIIRLTEWIDIKRGWETVVVGVIFLAIGIFLLNITPTPTPTPTPISTSASTLIPTDRVQIIEPKDNSFFDNQQGEIDLKVAFLRPKKDEYLWIVNNPGGTKDWYPQCNLEDRECGTPIKEDVWLYKYWIKKELGIHQINIVSANKSANLAFKNYRSQALSTGDWPAIPLPDGAYPLTKVTIIVE
ncbi:hypothetical protein [Planktothrix paucivesiculata]|uniref:Uncharacterized protein n=1 Tax=Planktothrix paucivesiculata PCC 9631 TaxID=671071 RepID=A0A7Z9BLX6_9CYAN|nr:hypothetical protein [Planktothrix paucivesiculata]VXD15298.1 hypothetical protein PL9631_120030 [Planktothrix paucivesiculata PCC 9631]